MAFGVTLPRIFSHTSPQGSACQRRVVAARLQFLDSPFLGYFFGKGFFLHNQKKQKTNPSERKLLRAKSGGLFEDKKPRITWHDDSQKRCNACSAWPVLLCSWMLPGREGSGVESRAGWARKQLEYLFFGKSNLEHLFWGAVPWLPGRGYMFNHLGSLCTFTSQCFSWVEEHFEFYTAHIFHWKEASSCLICQHLLGITWHRRSKENSSLVFFSVSGILAMSARRLPNGSYRLCSGSSGGKGVTC